MFSALFMLAASFGTTYARAVEMADIAVAVSARHDASRWFPREQDPYVARYRMAALLVVTAFHESSFDTTITGDSGRACGLMQVHPKADGPTCTEMRRSAYVSMDEGARVIDNAITECGSLVSALGAYVSGHCGWARGIVAKRCRDAGGCE